MREVNYNQGVKIAYQLDNFFFFFLKKLLIINFFFFFLKI